MKSLNALHFFQLQRQIFGVCPHSGQLFRLSDCHIYLKKKHDPDWLDEIKAAQRRIDSQNERLDEKEELIREQARIAGRRQADSAIRKVDEIFSPIKLNPDDAKVIFHPVDYVVFNGMKKGKMKTLLLLDRKRKVAAQKRLQKTIERAIERGRYDWVTLRVEENGKVIEE